MSTNQRLVVTRSPERDVAEWVEGPAGTGPVATASPNAPTSASHLYVGPGKRPTLLIAMVVGFLAIGIAMIFIQPSPPKPIEAELLATIADLSPVHAGVTALPKGAQKGETVRALRRLAEGDVVETDADGRARMRLDGGANVVIDGGTKLVLETGGFRLEKGRVFVTGSATPTSIDLGGGRVRMVGGAAGVDRREATKVYVANGELVARAGEKDTPVRVGETVTFEGGSAKVAPERGFDDWTGGLAAPWGAGGVPRRVVGELWGRVRPGDAGSPLTIRKHEVDAILRGELAETRVRTTFFNAGQDAVTGDFRIALPPSALVSGFAVSRGDARREGRIALAQRGAERGQLDESPQGDILEWAGEDWARGSIPAIAPGLTVTVEVAYTEWLPVRKMPGSHVVTYRYPLSGEGEAPTIGELFVRVDAGPARASRLAAGMGARSHGAVVELRKSDFVASADFVVDAEIPEELPKARAYVALGQTEEDEATILVRTEAPRLEGVEEGVTLAVVLDASASVDPALFAASRAFIESLVRGLGPKDRAIVLAADASVHAVGAKEIRAVDEGHKRAILDGLGDVTLGGATDLGRAFEAAADLLPADAPSAMVVYVGDGWPSVGDRSADAIRARLARRSRGVPRLGAVLVGPGTNRAAMGALVRGSGPVLEVGDSEEAAEAAVTLLERALVPTVTGVEIDLGPRVIRAYPRGETAATQGSTVTVVGKLNDDPPKDLTLTYRTGTEKRGEVIPLTLRQASNDGDVRRRWAEARAESMALAGRGREAVTDAALKASLLTPWTGWTTSGQQQYVATSIRQRVLDLALRGDAGLLAAVDAGHPPVGTLPGDVESELGVMAGSIESAISLSVSAAIDAATGQLRACRDARAALRPDLPGALQIALEVDGDGVAKGVTVTGAGDEPLARCVTTVVEGLSYPRLGEKANAKVLYTVVWPPPPALRGKKCSPTSTLPVALRRGVWVERIRSSGPLPTYQEARASCELASWTAKRTLLELMIHGQSGLATLSIADGIEREGDLEASGFLRKEALRRASIAEMTQVRRKLLMREVLPRAKFDERYAKARDDRERLAVVRTFLAFAPHSAVLRERLVSLLTSLGEKEALADEVRRLRADPLAEAPLLADAASALRASGFEAEARRTFGEIAERATNDPWSLALLGDRLRNEGWFDEASATYASLLELTPGDGATELRSALAHAGAGRVDLALRQLGRVARTGGKSGQTEMAILAERFAVLIANRALSREDAPAGERTALARAAAELTPLPPGQVFLVTWSAADRNAPGISLERGPTGAREASPAEAVAPRLGLASLVAAPGGTGDIKLLLSRPAAVVPGRPPGKVQVATFVDGKLVSGEFDLPRGPDDPISVTWTGTAFER